MKNFARKYLNPAMFGLVAGVDNLATSIAFAAVIFSGSVADGFAMGVSTLLLSSVLLAAFTAWRSHFPASVSQVQETGVAILAAAITAAAGSMGAATPDQRIATAFSILVIGTFGTGLLCYLSGRFRFGVLVRYLPFPVIAGFLAGSGWLLLQGALVIMTDAHDSLTALLSFTEPAVVGVLLPALAFAIVMSAAFRLSSSPLMVPALMVCSVLLFYAVLALNGMTQDAARALHWLPDAAGGSAGLTLPSPLQVVSGTDWHAVAGVLPMLASVPLLTIAGLLLNVSGLEAATGQEIDADRELKTTGQANLMVGLMGGAPGFTTLGMTLLGTRLRIQGRSAGLAAAAVLALALPFATFLAAGVPLFVAAGLMLLFAGELIYDWAIATRKTLPLLEWGVVLGIVLTMMSFGFMTGIATGLILSIITFVYNYGRLPVVRLAASGLERRSNTDRSPSADHDLDRDGHLIQIIELQGYLFFGTVEKVARAMRQRLAEVPDTRFMILDFRNVSGVDSAAVNGFVKIFNNLAKSGIETIVSPSSEIVENLVERAAESARKDALPTTAPDLDHALEAAESRLLAAHDIAEDQGDIKAYLERELGPHPRLSALVSAMERQELPAGATLIGSGELADDVFVLASGRVRAEVALADGRRMRLRSMTAGAVLGEIAFYTGGKRTADVVAEEPAILFRLTGETIRRLELEDPVVATLAHRLFAASLAERLALANRTVQLAVG